MAQFTELVATAVANADSRAELTASRARVVAAADETRRRIERDLHDGTQQRLVSLALALRATEAKVPPSWTSSGRSCPTPRRGSRRAVDDLQEYARGIHPAVLSKGGLAPALKTLARRSPIPVELRVRRRRPAADRRRGGGVLRRLRGAGQRGQARAGLGHLRRPRGRRVGHRRDGQRRRRGRRRPRPRLGPHRPQGPRRGARRDDRDRERQTAAERACTRASPWSNRKASNHEHRDRLAGCPPVLYGRGVAIAGSFRAICSLVWSRVRRRARSRRGRTRG